MSLKGVGLQYDLGYDIVATPVSVTGDYNHNGTVDAADYVVWRKGDLAADGRCAGNHRKTGKVPKGVSDLGGDGTTDCWAR